MLDLVPSHLKNKTPGLTCIKSETSGNLKDNVDKLKR